MFNAAIIFIIIFFFFSIYQFTKIINIGKKAYIWLGLRGLMSLILIALIIFPNITIFKNQEENILLIDDSKSMNIYKKELVEEIKKYYENHNDEDIWVYLFSGKKYILNGEEFDIVLDGENYTDICQIIKEIHNDKGEKNLSIKIISDGYITENLPSADDLPQNWKIETRAFYGKEKKDIAIKNLRVSVVDDDYDDRVKEIEVEIESTIDASGLLTLENRDKIFLNKELDILRGNQKLKIPCEINKYDSSLIGRITFEDDENPQNDIKRLSYSNNDDLTYLVVSYNKEFVEVKEFLKDMGIRSIFIEPEDITSYSLNKYDFDGIILNNCDGTSLSTEGLESLKNAVGKEGKGCFVIGGENSFGLGNYRESGLEQMMAVEDKPSGNRRESDTSLVIIIDTSGSMDDESQGIKKISLAKSGLNSVLNQLNEKDNFGIIAFSDTYEWVQPIRAVEELNMESKEFINLGAKGGTLIKPALVQAYMALAESGSEKNRHILFITDGQGDQENYDDLMEKIISEEITLSSIGIGKEIASEFLRGISEKTGGDYYEVNNLKELPKIMVRDIYRNGKELLQSGTYEIREIDSKIHLNKYIAVSCKDESQLVFSTDSGDPILALNNYGIGKVCNLMTKFDNSWSGNIMGSDFYKKIQEILFDLPLQTFSDEIICKFEENRITLYGKNGGNNITDLEILYQGNVVYSAKEPFRFSDRLIYGTSGEKGRYRINAYNENGDSIFIKDMWLDYSAEHNLNQVASWVQYPNLFSKKNTESLKKQVKTGYRAWPALAIIFIILVYIRKKY